MAGFSKQYCERHMPERQWDFDIDKIVNRVDRGTATIEMCEGYGFTFIGKKKDGIVVLGFYDKSDDTIEWKKYVDIVSSTRIRFDDITVLNGEVDSGGDIIYIEGVLIPESVSVYVNLDSVAKQEIGKAELRYEGDSIKAKIITNVLTDGYPCASYKVIERQSNVITKMELIDISICGSPNVDKTIKTLQEQILENRK